MTGNVTAADIGLVRVEIYRVFPKDSANPPSGNVPTRTNSPSDIAFDERETSAELSVSTSLIGRQLHGEQQHPGRYSPDSRPDDRR